MQRRLQRERTSIGHNCMVSFFCCGTDAFHNWRSLAEHERMQMHETDLGFMNIILHQLFTLTQNEGSKSNVKCQLSQGP